MSKRPLVSWQRAQDNELYLAVRRDQHSAGPSQDLDQLDEVRISEAAAERSYWRMLKVRQC